MNTGRWLASAVVVLSLWGSSAPARAQDGARDPAAAESLFQRGVDLLKQKDWDGACKAFEASMKLNPSVGTQINVARCAEHYGLVARAWSEFKRAKALNAETPLAKRKANVESYVDGEIAKLEPRLPWVTIKVHVRHEHYVAPATVVGLKIERDGVIVPAESLDIALPVDPGKRSFRASAPGYRTSTVDLELAEGQKKEVQLELVAEPLVAPPPDPKLPPPVRRPAEDAPRPLLWAGVTIGAVGAAGLIVAGVTGGLALSDHDELEALAENGDCEREGDVIQCQPAQQAEVEATIERGETLALVSTVTLFAGAGLLATGVVLTVVGATAPADSGPPAIAFAPWISPDVAGLTVGGVLD